MMNIVFDFAGVVFHWSPPALLRETLPHGRPTTAARALMDEAVPGFSRAATGPTSTSGASSRARWPTRIARRTGIAEPGCTPWSDAIPRT